MRAALRKSERGQALSEYALSVPIVFMLLAGAILAGFYAFRAAEADWGIFATGVAAGSYHGSAAEQARSTVFWFDIRQAIDAGEAGERTVRSTISIETERPWLFGIVLAEAQEGTSFFRLWRFYPDPSGDE